MRCRVAAGGAGWARDWLRRPRTRSACPGLRLVAGRTARSLRARIRNTSRWQPASGNCNSRSAAATSSEMTISLTGRARVSRRGRRSKGESAQLLMMPSSAQTLHCHRIGAGGSVRSTIIRPGQRRLPGRRRHGSALSQAVPASPAVAARTMLLRCPANRRAGPGVPAGRSRKWCRSVTNISQGLYRPRSHVAPRAGLGGVAGQPSVGQASLVPNSCSPSSWPSKKVKRARSVRSSARS